MPLPQEELSGGKCYTRISSALYNQRERRRLDDEVCEEWKLCKHKEIIVSKGELDCSSFLS